MPDERKVVLRSRAGHAHVSNTELMFDLVYVFAVTQTSHYLLGALTPLGAAQALVLWFAVWLGWQYTCWMTNWFNPDALPVRLALFATMLAALVMAAALPQAFGGRGLLFAGCYAAMQVGRTVFILAQLGRDSPLAPNYRRILGWNGIAALLWLAGGLAEPGARLALWAGAVACEYVSPMLGFWLPGLGRSRTTDWTIAGGHLAERCQLFVIVALGESILVTGATLAEHAHPGLPTAVAFLVAFIGSLAMWWMYFDTSSAAGTRAIERSADPGRVGSRFHYVHVVLVGAVIAAAVANELVIAHPDERVATAAGAVLIGGPAAYVLGNGLYKTAVYGRFPLSHAAGLVAFAALWLPAFYTDRLMVAGLVALVLIGVAGWETWSRATPSSR